MQQKITKKCNKKWEKMTKDTIVKMHKIPQLLFLYKNCIDLVNATKKKKIL